LFGKGVIGNQPIFVSVVELQVSPKASHTAVPVSGYPRVFEPVFIPSRICEFHELHTFTLEDGFWDHTVEDSD